MLRTVFLKTLFSLTNTFDFILKRLPKIIPKLKTNSILALISQHNSKVTSKKKIESQYLSLWGLPQVLTVICFSTHLLLTFDSMCM